MARGTAGQRLEVDGEGFAPLGKVTLDGKPVSAEDRDAIGDLVRAAALCNEGDLHRRDGEWAWRGDPTDIALLAFGVKSGIARETLLDRYPQLNEIPFEPEHQFAASFYRVDAETRAFVKGAPERVLRM